MKKITGTDMQISLDTNVWILGLLEHDRHCLKILMKLSDFQVVVPNQIRKELSDNLSKELLKYFYQIALQSNVHLNYENVPDEYIDMFESKGLKKGDAVIGGFCEWQKIDKIVSENRDFLRGLSAGHHFEVMSPQDFCEAFAL
jgi:predicted nucleic acid-binding protein